MLALAGTAVLAADPQVTQFTDRPDPVPAGGNVTYTARIDNGTIDAATGVRVSVPVPSGTTFVSATAPCASVGAEVVCDLGTVGGSGTDVRVLDFVFRALGPGTTTISATATLSAGNDTNAANNVQSQTTTVVEGSDLSLAKTDTPDPVVGGANVTYTLTPANAGPNAARAIVLTDNLPPSTSFVSASGAGWTCSHAGGVVTCTHPGPHAPGAAIAPVGIVARVNATGGSVTNSASVAPGEGGMSDPDASNNTVTADTAVLPGADASVARKVVVAGNPASAGGSVTFRIEPRNGGPVASSDAVVTDTLPAGWSVVSVSGPNWSCSVTGATARCTRATLPAGAADDITLVATAPPAAAVGPTGTTYTNTAAITTGSNDPTPGNNAASVQVTVLPDGADLRIAMSKTPTRVSRGAEATAALRVTNNGPRVATGRLRVVDQLAAGEVYVSSTGTDWSCTPDGRTVVCDYPNTGGLAVGATAPVLTVVSRVTATGPLFNTACTGGSVPGGVAAGTTASPPAEGDYNTGNDCTTVLSTGTAGGPDLAITKITSTPAGGDKVVSINEASVTYTLRVTNATALPAAGGATGVRISDTVPAAVAGTAIAPPVAAVSPGSTASFSCNVSSATVTCTQSGGVLLPGETVTVPITVSRPLAEGSHTNTATVTNTVEGDSNSSNNTASDTVTIGGIADVELTAKTVSLPAVRAGERATYVVSYRNNGPSQATSVTLSDSFAFPAGDPGFTVVSVASTKPGSTCSIAAGAQLTPAAPAYTCNLGSLDSGETQSVTLVISPNFQTGNPTRNVSNTATLATVTPESPDGGDNGNNRRSVALEVDPARVDLLANKVDLQDPVPFAGNAILDYSVTVTSNTAASATGVRISETMTPPAGKRVRFVCDTAGPASATCNAPSLCTATGVVSAPGAPVSFSCVLPAGTAATGAAQGSLAPRQSKTVFLRFEAIDSPSAAGDTYRNVATAVANEPDSFPGNDAADEQTSVRQRIDLAVAKTSSAAGVAMRQPFTWTVRVTNNGPGNSVQTDLADTLPAGAVLTGPVAWTKTAPAGNGNCTATGAAVACALGRLDNGGVATISVPVRFDTFPAGGSATNTAVVDTDMTKIGGADPVPANDRATNSVTVTRSSLAGTVFDDRDRAGGNAGTPQLGEPRIAGVSVRLAGTDAYGSAVDLTTTTDATGGYSFADLSPSDGAGYTVTAAQPAGFGNSPAAPPVPGTGGTYIAAAPGGGSAFGGVVLGANVAATGYDFPELRQASLGGAVYIDRNGNGVRDAGTDDAVTGATVRLLDAATGALVATVATDAAGAYLFTGLDAARSYTLEQPLPASPAGLQNGPVNPGRVGGAPCATGCTAQPDTPVAGTDRIAAIGLGAGDGTGFDFGERQRAAVAGIVYVDADRDNALTGADSGRVAGVVLRLVQGADCTSGTTLQTQSTGADGGYRFDGVAALQDYLVCQTQPAGYGNGNARGVAGSNSIAVAALPAAGSLDNHFGETTAALAGSVYQDNGGGTPANADNGVRDAGEAGIAGVTITLTGRDIAGSAVDRSAVTDAQGNYRFDNLLQSDAAGYTLAEGAIPPAAGSFGDGRETAGSAGGSTAVNDRIGAIVLGAGVQATGYLFGELSQAAVTGTVYLDRNRSGTLDAVPIDGRLAGVTVALYAGASCTGTPVATATTDANGGYTLAGATAGLPYAVCETQPAGYGEGSATAGMGATVAGASVITIAALPAGGSPGNHFGERAGSLAGSVFLDGNNDGVRNGTDAGIGGVTVTLSGTDAAGNAVSRTATTDGTGAWRFDDLLAAGAGGYTVTEQAAQPVVNGAATLDGRTTAGSAGGTATAPGATPSAVSGVALAAGADATGYTFAEIAASSIAGAVFVDANDNGTRDAGEGGLGGVTLSVTGTDDLGAAVNRSVTTAADGTWSVTGLRPGTYTVTQPTQPAGTSNGATVAGSAGGTATARATVPSAITGIVLVPGTTATGYGFAELSASASIAGSVYQDNGAGNAAAADNGVRDAGEAGIAGVTITLTGRDIAGSAVDRSAVTDAQGNYRFDNLLQSDAAGYTLAEGAIPPAAGSFGDGRETAGSAGGSTAVNDRIGAIVLGAGVQATGYLFGELSQAAVTGTVYLDRNRSGTLDAVPIDGRLAGVTVALYAGASCTGTPVATATTDANGGYTLAGATAGLPYAVCETQPAGYGEGSATAGMGATVAGASVITIAALPAGGSPGNHFGERAGSLAGSVFLDGNNDGVRNGTDAGIGGVTVTLSGTDAAGNAVSRTATTDGTGAWRFDDLLAAGAGGYTVTEQAAQPVVNGAATLDGRTTAGSAGGTATAPGATPSAVSGVALAAGADATGYTFAEIAASSIAGAVFVDANDNGTRDAGEGGLGGVTLSVTGTDDLGAAVNRSVTTAADGTWSVTGLRPGTYTVTQPTQPAGTSNGATVAGSAGGTATARATVPSAITGIVLVPGTTATGYGFAELAATASIAGRVGVDADNDGSIAAGETGISGVTVELSGTTAGGAAVSRSVVTDAQGSFRFDGLLPGTYAVRLPAQPAGTLGGRASAGTSGGTATAPGAAPAVVGGVALAAGQTATGLGFGALTPASISGLVYVDSDGNGRPDAGEPGLAGVTLRLSGTDDLGAAVTVTATTDAAGAWTFAGLRPGSYTVTEPDQPPGTTDGATRAGSAGGTATPTGTLPSAVSGIVLAPGARSTGNDFAETGSSPDLLTSVTSVEPRFTVGSTGTYTVRVRNAGSSATSGAYTVAGRLPPGIVLDAVASGSGWTCSGAAGGQVYTCTSAEPLAPGATNPNPLTLRVRIDKLALASSPASNAVLVEGGGEVAGRAPSTAERDAFAVNAAALPLCSAAIAQNACRSATPVQAAASVSGTVWLDGGASRGLLDGGDRRLGDWIVEVVDPAGAAVVARTETRADGSWRVDNLTPGVPLAVRFRDPQSGIVWAYPVNGETAPGSSGATCDPAAAQAGGGFSSCAAGGADASLGVVLAAGRDLPQQSLPVDPSVVYDSATRQPVGGRATVTLAPVGSCPGWDPATGVVGVTPDGYTVNGGAISMTTGADGRFQFVLSPAAPARCDFGLAVAPPSGYAFPSALIPPAAGTFVPPGAPGGVYAVQPQAVPPSGAAGVATTYHLAYAAGSALPRLVHNHVPLDTALPAGLALQKTGDRAQAEIGDTVRYTVTVQRSGSGAAAQTTVVDRLPAGFTYIPGTATVDGRPLADPAGRPGPRLTFELGPTPASGQIVLQYRLRIGVGAQQGDGENRARAYACAQPASCVGADGATPLPGAVASNEGRHRVRLAGGVFTTEACVLGKIFVDCNGNHVQDAEELGIPGVRLLFSDGTFLVSDSEGKYSYCGLPPRGHVLKVDTWTLPRGSRLTTTSNRNLGDAGSLWLDLKNGELHRADFAEGSCSNTVLDQVKARRAQGGVRSVETERPRGPALRFESKAHGLGGAGAPRQATDSADQPVPKPRDARSAPAGGATDAAR